MAKEYDARYSGAPGGGKAAGYKEGELSSGR